MKLLKLVYIAHGWHLGLTQTQLIDEDVEAWRYGPVIPSLYRSFKTYGNQPIPATEVASNVQLSNPERVYPFLERVWNAYKDCTAIELSSMTHAKGTPWYQVWEVQSGKNYMGADISPQSIPQGVSDKKAVAEKRAIEGGNYEALDSQDNCNLRKCTKDAFIEKASWVVNLAIRVTVAMV